MPRDENPTETALPAGRSGLREVSDARAFRALAHPVRLALLECLVLEGPLTATEAGEKIGEAQVTCSFHLRQLAKYGFVEEAGGRKGRARPWRITSTGMHFSSVQADPETELAAGALVQLLRERQLERYRTWLKTRASYPRAWREAAGDSEFVFWLTPKELEELDRELTDFLLPRFRERLLDPMSRPAGAVPVELLLFSYPMVPPAAES